MYEFLYDYVKPRYGEKAKLCYMDTDSFIVYITDDLRFFKKRDFDGLRARTYSYLINDGSEDKKTKDTEKCSIKRKHKF